MRLAIDTDEDDLVRLARMAVQETRSGLGFDEERVRGTVQQYLATERPTIFVVEQKRLIIGALVCNLYQYRFTSGHYAVQEVLYVRPDKRGTRAAVLLMKTLFAWSERLGAREIAGGNDNAFQSERMLRFFERFGFEQVGYYVRRRLQHG